MVSFEVVLRTYRKWFVPTPVNFGTGFSSSPGLESLGAAIELDRSFFDGLTFIRAGM